MHLQKLHDSEVSVSPNPLGGKGMSQAKLIAESGLYKLIMRSDKADARRFQDWVTREVLPAIRKDGGPSLCRVMAHYLSHAVRIRITDTVSP